MNRVNFADMLGEGQCSRSREVQGHYTSISCRRCWRGWIRKRVEIEIGEEQQSFRKGTGMTDGMFVLRQLVEKRFGGPREG